MKETINSVYLLINTNESSKQKIRLLNTPTKKGKCHFKLRNRIRGRHPGSETTHQVWGTTRHCDHGIEDVLIWTRRKMGVLQTMVYVTGHVTSVEEFVQSYNLYYWRFFLISYTISFLH